MNIFFFFFILKSSLEDMFLDFERERNIDMREKYWSVASCMHPNRGLNLQPRYVPWPGIEPATFWCMWPCSNQPNHLARARRWIYFYLKWFFLIFCHWLRIRQTELQSLLYSPVSGTVISPVFAKRWNVLSTLKIIFWRIEVVRMKMIW